MATLAPPVDAMLIKQKDPFTDLVRATGSELDYPPIRSASDELELLAELHDGGIKVYRPDDIAAYRKAALDEANVGLAKYIKAAVVLRVIATIAVVPFIVNMFVNFPSVVSNIVFAVMLASFIGNGLCNGHVTRTTIAWKLYALRDYPREMPMSLIHTMNWIKGEIKDLTFSVDEFQVRRAPMDPLLYVKRGYAEFCIAVWDEPKFDAEPHH